jgi:hypothetical protein
MLDPRIYRTGFVAVALAVIVFAFSLGDQRGALSPTLAPDAFNGPATHSLMNAFAKTYPDRRPGSNGDTALAADIARRLRRIQGGYTVTTDVFKGRTVDGTRTLENVVATRVGESPGTIVVVSHRDSLADGTSCGASPPRVCGAADLSGSAVLIELARVLAGQTQHRTIVLASTSGSAGGAGAAELARNVPGPVDAVIALGDLAGKVVRQPIIVPWSSGQPVAPTQLRNTIASALGSQAAPHSTGTSVAGQLAHLAFPFTLSEQGPFGAQGIPAATLSLSGDRAPPADASTSADQMTAVGRSVLLSINALDSGPQLERAAPYVLFQGKVIPAWAIRLLVLAFMLPVLVATIDGLARARRRGHSITRAVVWVLASAVPFALAALLVVAARLVGVIDIAPPGPVAAGAVPMHTSGVVLLCATALVIALAFFAARPFVIWLGGAGRVAKVRDGASDCLGAAAALLLVMCVTALAMWVTNPFAAAFVIPALHLWMWLVDPEVRLHPLGALALLLGGLIAPALLVLFFAHQLGAGPIEVLWNGLLLLAGGHLALVVAIEYSVLLGCFVSAALIARRKLSAPRPEDAPVTVRGPITYAGPGSLGGTESALRR